MIPNVGGNPTGDELPPNAPAEGGKRFRTPTILQMEATECGAACLAMILAHYGLWVPLEELRVACGVSRDGSKAANVLRAARRYGLHAKGFRKEPASVTSLPFPQIIFWNFNHFVVLEGIDPRHDRVWLNDPGTGPRTVTMEEFDQSFTGICLAFRKTPELRPGGKKPNIVGNLRRRIQGSGGALSFVMLVTLLLVIPGLAIPVFSKIFVDEILVGGLGNWVMPLLIGMGLTAILRGLLTWLQQVYLSRLELKLALQGSAQFLWHVMRLPVDFFNQRFPGDIGDRVAANDRVAQMLSGQLATNVIGIFTIVFYAAVMMFYDVMLTLIGVGLASLNFLALRLVSRAREDYSRRLVREQGQLAAASISGIQLIETLKASGSEASFFSRWSGLQAKYLNAQQQLSTTTTMLNVVPPLLAALTTAAILGVGGLRVMDGALTVGALVAFQSLMQRFSAPIEGLVQLGGNLQTVKGDLARIDDVMNYRTEERLDDSAKVTGGDKLATGHKLLGKVEIKDLVFGYNRTDPPLIDHLDLTIQPGQRIALVGGSGSGKSTIAKVVCGLHRPWSGQILFDGIPMEQLAHQDFANSVASVDQDIFLFEGTVRENVSMWDETVTETVITQALRDAAILDAIESRPGRYDSHIAEGGTNFSGGQRQRLEIARALATNPSVLILDEATSALDPLVEKQIDDSIRRRGCTCIIVAHRLSTIRDSDEIIVLERGRAVQRGTHEELIAVDGPYRNLIQSEEGATV